MSSALSYGVWSQNMAVSSKSNLALGYLGPGHLQEDLEEGPPEK